MRSENGSLQSVYFFLLTLCCEIFFLCTCQTEINLKVDTKALLIHDIVIPPAAASHLSSAEEKVSPGTEASHCTADTSVQRPDRHFVV